MEPKQYLDINGHQWISMDINGYQWISIDILSGLEPKHRCVTRAARLELGNPWPAKASPSPPLSPGASDSPHSSKGAPHTPSELCQALFTSADSHTGLPPQLFESAPSPAAGLQTEYPPSRANGSRAIASAAKPARGKLPCLGRRTTTAQGCTPVPASAAEPARRKVALRSLPRPPNQP